MAPCFSKKKLRPTPHDQKRLKNTDRASTDKYRLFLPLNFCWKYTVCSLRFLMTC